MRGRTSRRSGASWSPVTDLLNCFSLDTGVRRYDEWESLDTGPHPAVRLAGHSQRAWVAPCPRWSAPRRPRPVAQPLAEQVREIDYSEAGLARLVASTVRLLQQGLAA